MSNTYLLAITCYNCAPQITRVLDKITPEIADLVDEIMVINNRSTDNLEEVVLDYIAKTDRKLATEQAANKIHLYRNADNYSLGGSHKVAFLHGKELGATHVIILHGDDQADAGDIPAMIEAIESGTGEDAPTTVLGSRFNKDSTLVGYDKARIFGNKTLNVAFSALSGKHVEDLGSGLNVFALGDLDEDRYLNFADKLTFNFELLLDLLDRDVSFAYHPIMWREEDQVSNARNFNIASTAMKNLLRWRFARSSFFGGSKTATDYRTEEVLPCS